MFQRKETVKEPDRFIACLVLLVFYMVSGSVFRAVPPGCFDLQEAK